MGLARFELLRLCALGFWVIGANMQRKLFIALQLEVAHHFVERCAGGRTRRFERPATFRTAKTAKMLLINPNQISVHGLPGSRRPNVVLLHTCCPRVVKGRSALLSYRSGVSYRVLRDCSRQPSPCLGRGMN